MEKIKQLHRRGLGSKAIATDTIIANATIGGVPEKSNQAFKEWFPPTFPPQVPSVTGWGIVVLVTMLAVLMPLALRQRMLFNIRR